MYIYICKSHGQDRRPLAKEPVHDPALTKAAAEISEKEERENDSADIMEASLFFGLRAMSHVLPFLLHTVEYGTQHLKLPLNGKNIQYMSSVEDMFLFLFQSKHNY